MLLTPAISNYLNQLLTRLELYKKTDITELDQKQKNGLHNIRAKVKSILDDDVPLSTACPLTSTLMDIWLQRQYALAENLDVRSDTTSTPATPPAKFNELEKRLLELEDRAFFKVLNEKTTTTKLYDVRDLFALVNEVCDTLKDQQSEVRKLKSLGKSVVHDSNLIATLRQSTLEDLAAPSISGRVWVDCVIDQLNSETDVAVSPLLTNKRPEESQCNTVESDQTTPLLGSRPASGIYDNIVSFESGLVPQESDEGQRTIMLEDDLFANPSVVRPVGRRARVKFNTQKELQETALLGLCGDSAEPVVHPPARELVPPNRMTSRRRMSINTRFQASMEQISDELKGLNEW